METILLGKNLRKVSYLSALSSWKTENLTRCVLNSSIATVILPVIKCLPLLLIFSLSVVSVFQEDNSDKYETLRKFLPNNIVSIASYIKATPTANFATASAMAAKVWVMAGFEEYATRKGENEKSTTLLKGYTVGVADPDKEFKPSATFEVDAYIKDIEDEIEGDEEDGTPTGRLLLNVLLPGYKELVHQIPLVAPVEDNVAKFIKANYNVGDTARLYGDLVAMRVQLDNEDEEKEKDYFGKEVEQQYTTKFIREYVITRGPKTPIKQGEEGSISTEDVKKGLALRENLMVENGKRKPKDAAENDGAKTEEEKVEDAPAAQSEPAAQPAPAAASAKASATSSNDEDFEF